MKLTPPLGDMPGHLIRRLNQQSTSVFQRRMKEAGYSITPVQFAALSTLSQQPDLDQATLAGLIAYDPATIGGVVKRLEQKGLIGRISNTADRRAFRLALTARGESALEAVIPIVSNLQNDILAKLSEEERSTLIGLLQKVLPDGKDSPDP